MEANDIFKKVRKIDKDDLMEALEKFYDREEGEEPSAIPR